MINVESNNWRNEFWQLLMRDELEKAFNIKYDHFPPSFFKYKTLNKYTIDSIEKDEIWLADITTLNDPFECAVQLDYDQNYRIMYANPELRKILATEIGIHLSDSEIQEIIASDHPNYRYTEICAAKHIPLRYTPDELLSKIQDQWNAFVQETNEHLKITCFSEYNDSLLMWAHYANEHRGICIEYDFRIEDRDLRAFLLPIVYKDQVFKLAAIQDWTTMKKIGSSLVKSLDWHYEAEWRLVKVKGHDPLPEKVNVPKPVAIYLGARFHLNPESEKRRFFSLVAARQIPLYQMGTHPTEYKVAPIKQTYL